MTFSLADDFYLTACMSIVRWVIMRHREYFNSEIPSDDEADYLPPPPVDKRREDTTPDPLSAGAPGAEASADRPAEDILSQADTPDPLSIEIENSDQTQLQSKNEAKTLTLPPLDNKEPKTSRKGRSHCMYKILTVLPTNFHCSLN